MGYKLVDIDMIRIDDVVDYFFIEEDKLNVGQGVIKDETTLGDFVTLVSDEEVREIPRVLVLRITRDTEILFDNFQWFNLLKLTKKENILYNYKDTLLITLQNSNTLLLGEATKKDTKSDRVLVEGEGHGKYGRAIDPREVYLVLKEDEIILNTLNTYSLPSEKKIIKASNSFNSSNLKVFLAVFPGILYEGYATIVSENEKSARKEALRIFQEKGMEVEEKYLKLKELDLTESSFNLQWDGNF